MVIYLLDGLMMPVLIFTCGWVVVGVRPITYGDTMVLLSPSPAVSGRQVSPGGEFLLTGQKEPKATRDSDFPGTLNGAGSEKNLAQRGLFVV